MKVNSWRVPECDLSLLQTIDLLHLDLDGCNSVTDECILKLINKCMKDIGKNGNKHHKVADVGVSSSSRGCRKLQSIDLVSCGLVADAGISALSHGCGQLQRIVLTPCSLVTDAGISALGRGCGQLQIVDLEDCNLVTDAGVSALGHGCSQLQSIVQRLQSGNRCRCTSALWSAGEHRS